jgi:(p)ppGpp synthase/HD superfamily hydrolase
MHVFSTPGARAAHRFADVAHVGQFRRYVRRPYIEHPVAVARLVQRFDHDETMVMAALLHDVKEDCGVSREELVREFGIVVADLVDDLSDVSTPADGNRAVRKAIDRAHAAHARPKAKTIKCLDLTHNSHSIVRHDKAFARVFLAEKTLLLPVLADASDPRAFELARRVHERACARLQH